MFSLLGNIMKPVWSLSFWSLLESRISKIKVVGFMGQSCHSESSGYLSNHATFIDHESDISCNEKFYSPRKRKKSLSHEAIIILQQCINCKNKRNNSKARQFNFEGVGHHEKIGLCSDRGPSYRCRVQRRASVVFVLGESWEYWLATITSWWMQNASFTLQSKGCFDSNLGYLQAVSFRATATHKPFGLRIGYC